MSTCIPSNATASCWRILSLAAFYLALPLWSRSAEVTNPPPVALSFGEIRRQAGEGRAEAQNYVGDCLVYGVEGQRQDFQEAARWYRKAAVQDLAVAQFNLGLLYEAGRGLATNLARAAEWYRRAALQGQSDAQSGLASLYFNGRGMPTNRAEALRWFNFASTNNHPEAAYHLGLMYRDGLEQTADKILAKDWFQRAANQQHAESQWALGELLLKTEPPESLSTNALHWIRRAATQEVVAAQHRLASLLENAAPSEAIEWYRRAAERSHLEAQLRLGQLLSREGQSQTNQAEGAVWLRIASDSALPEAEVALGELYWHGRGVPQNRPAATRWFLQAAKQDYAPAYYWMGLASLTGAGTKGDETAALSWLRKAALKNEPRAALALSQRLVIGSKTLQKDASEAEEWARKAAESGLPQAVLWYAEKLETGLSEAPSPTKSIPWYRKAAEAGLPQAQAALGRLLASTARAGSAQEADALHWIEKAASTDHRDGVAQKAFWLLRRSDASSDKFAEGVRLLRDAAERGHNSAQTRLGILLAEGRGLPIDKTQAERWMRRGMDAGDIAAGYHLAMLLSTGKLHSPTELFLLLNRSASGGYGPAQAEVARCYLAGKWIAASRVKAWHWMSLASATGEPGATDALKKIEDNLSSEDRQDLQKAEAARRSFESVVTLQKP